MEINFKNNEFNKILIITDIHHVNHNWGDATLEERMTHLVENVNKQYEKDPFDMILCLGDYSLDHWQWGEGGSYLHNPPLSNTDLFMKNIYPKFPTKTFIIPGNHEQYGNEKWKEITGFDRQYSLVYGDNVFLMLDTFGGDLDPTENRDGTYTGVDTDLLKKALADHPDKKIFLCMHDLYPTHESEEIKQLIRENDRIICAFTGHIHKSNTLILGNEWRNFPVFYCGDYSYSADPLKPCNWGFRTLDLNDGFSTDYINGK